MGRQLRGSCHVLPQMRRLQVQGRSFLLQRRRRLLLQDLVSAWCALALLLALL